MFKSATTKKIASNTIYQIIGKVISMLITVFTTIVVTRAYGREAFGEFSLMQGWPALFFVIADFGLNAIATRELSKDQKLFAKVLGNVFLIRILLSLFLILISYGVLTFFPYSQSLKFGIHLSLWLILAQSLYATTNIVFQVKLRYDLSTLGYLSGYLLIFLAVLCMSYLKVPVSWVNFSYVVGMFLTFIINLGLVRSLGIVPELKLDTQTLAYLLGNSLPLGLMFVFSQISFKADSVMLSVLQVPDNLMLSKTEAVALYSLPYKVFEVALVVPTFFMNSVYPVLVTHMTYGKEKLKSTFLKSITFLVGSGLVCGLVGVILSPLAIKLLGGPTFSQSVLVLQILLGGLVIYFVTQPLAWLIVTLGKQKYLPFIYLVSAGFNVLTNYFYIPKYSFYASSVITHLSEALILIMLVFAALRAWKEKYGN